MWYLFQGNYMNRNKGIECLLINPRQHEGGKMPPLGLIALAAYARQSGLSVKVCDANVLGYTDQETLDIIRDLQPHVVGFTFMTPQVPYVRALSAKVRQEFPGIVQIAGGVHVSAVPEQCLKQFAYLDYLVLGEGEETLVEILKKLHLRDDFDPSTVDGLAFRAKGDVVRTKPRRVFSDLNTLPMPAWDELPLKKYVVTRACNGQMQNKEGMALTISGSRGCPYDCIFCASHSVFARGYRRRSHVKIVDEMEYLYKNYGIDYFFFVDELLFFKKENIINLANEIIRRELPINWTGISRVDSPAICDDVLSLVKIAGCKRIDFGVESGSPKILKEIGKQINLSQIYRAHLLTHRHGISTVTLMMVGHPNESKQDFLDSIRLILDLESENAMFGAATPFPGTELYRIARNNGWLRSDDWGQYYINNSNQVMRNVHFVHDEINYLSIYANLISYVVGRLAVKKHYAQREMKSLWSRFRLFYSVIYDRYGFARANYFKVRTLSRIVEMFIAKDQNRERFEELIQDLDVKGMVDNRIKSHAYEEYLSETIDPVDKAVIIAPSSPRQLSLVVKRLLESSEIRSITVYTESPYIIDVEQHLGSMVDRVEVKNLETKKWSKIIDLFCKRQGKRKQLLLLLFDQDRIRKNFSLARIASELSRIVLMIISLVPNYVVLYDGSSCSGLQFLRYLTFKWLGAGVKHKWRIFKGISLIAGLHAYKLARLSGRLNSFETPPSIPESMSTDGFVHRLQSYDS
jgi:anaerobic magnesium-protoporphyrin IX monomethyl ester cyclase